MGPSSWRQIRLKAVVSLLHAASDHPVAAYLIVGATTRRLRETLAPAVSRPTERAWCPQDILASVG